MSIIYDRDIQCRKCKSYDITVKPSGRDGILYCTCICGEKFVAQTDGSDVINRYVTSRQKLFAVVEKASLRDGDYARVGTGLTSLADGFDTLVDIDPLYYWYKLEYITSGFKDLSREEEAKTEYGKLPKTRYFFSPDDNTRNEIYEKRYAEYIRKCEKSRGDKERRKRRKRNAIVACVTALIGVALVGAGAFIGVYRPAVDTEAGVSAVFGNAPYGIFGKFRAGAEVKAVEQGEPDYGTADKLFKEASPKAKLYSVSLLKGGVKSLPRGEVFYKISLDGSFRNDRIAVYEVNEDGSYNPVKAEVNTAGFVTFSSAHTGIFAVAEKPYSVNFDCAGGSGASGVLVPWGEGAKEPTGEQVTRTGYTLSGWLVDGEKYDFASPVYKDLTLTAEWTANNYTVSYEVDGVTVKTEAVAFGEQFTPYAVQKTGYDLAWYFDGNEVKGGEWAIAENATLTAEWTPRTYTVKLESGVTECCNAVRNGAGSLTATFDKAVPALAAAALPKRTGYVFDGYYAKPQGGGKKYLNGEGGSVADWTEDNGTVLYANWQLDPDYAGFTYISTADGLNEMAGNTGGKYLLTCDLNLNGAAWKPLPNFSGVFDGGCHSIYNYKITEGVAENQQRRFGFIGVLSGNVRNLQIGKAGYTTSIVFDGGINNWAKWHLDLDAGAIAGFVTGTVSNCRAVNFSVDISAFAQQDTYKNKEFYANAGGICGVLSGGTVERCFATGCTLSAFTESKWNSITATARAGGVAGYASGSKITNCYTADCTFTAKAKTFGEGGGFLGIGANPGGAPFARAGGIVAEAVSNSTLSVNVVNKSNAVNSKIEWSGSVANNGTSLSGSMFGYTYNTNPSNLIGIGTSLQCNGANANYGGFSVIGNDSYSELVAKSSVFANGCWYSAGGKIAVKFFED